MRETRSWRRYQLFAAVCGAFMVAFVVRDALAPKRPLLFAGIVVMSAAVGITISAAFNAAGVVADLRGPSALHRFDRSSRFLLAGLAVVTLLPLLLLSALIPRVVAGALVSFWLGFFLLQYLPRNQLFDWLELKIGLSLLHDSERERLQGHPSDSGDQR